MGASQVSRICASLDDTVSDLRERAFADTAFSYLRLDTTCIKARDGGRVSSTAVVTASGAGADGYRRLPGPDAIDTESYAGWLGFPGSLRERGVRSVLCAADDAHEGLRRAAVSPILSAVFRERDPQLVRELYRLACNEVAASALRPAGFSKTRSPMPWRTWTSPIPTT